MNIGDGKNTYEILEKQNETLSRELERQKQLSANNTIRGRQTTLLSRYYKFLLCVVPTLILLPYLDQLNLVKLVLDGGEEVCKISLEQAEALLLVRGFVTTSLLYKPYQVIADFAYVATAVVLIGFFGYNYFQSQSDKRFDALKIRHVSSSVDKIKIVIFTFGLVLITVFVVRDAKKQVAYYENLVELMDEVVITQYDASGVKYFLASNPELRGSCFTSSNIEVIPKRTTRKSDKPFIDTNSKTNKNKALLDLSTQ